MYLFLILAVGNVITETTQTPLTIQHSQISLEDDMTKASRNHQTAPNSMNTVDIEGGGPLTTILAHAPFNQSHIRKKREERQPNNRKRHRVYTSTKLYGRYNLLKCAKRFSEMCECPTDLIDCDKNETDIMTKSKRESKNKLSYIQVNCESLCSAFTCREVKTRTTNITKLNSSMYKNDNMSSENGTTMNQMYNNENITSENGITNNQTYVRENKTSEAGTIYSMYSEKNTTSENDDSFDWTNITTYNRILLVVNSCFLSLNICHFIMTHIIPWKRLKGLVIKKQDDRQKVDLRDTKSSYLDSGRKADFFASRRKEFSSTCQNTSEDKRRSISDSIDTLSMHLFPVCCTKNRPSLASETILNSHENAIENNDINVKGSTFTDEHNEKIVKNKQPIKDGTLPKKEKEEIVKERKFTVKHDVIVSVVKPLTGPADEPIDEPADEPTEDIPADRLNWDKIFRYLAKNLPTNDYKLFFNILYDNCDRLRQEGRDPGSIIEKVEHRVRGGSWNAETLMFELFNNWKQLMGTNVSVAYIEQALEERSNNLVLDRFKKFVRKTPLLPIVSECKSVRPAIMHDDIYQFHPSRNELISTNYMLPYVNQYRVLPSSNLQLSSVTNGPVIEEVGDFDNISLTSSSNSSSQLTDMSSVVSFSSKNVKRKRHKPPIDTMMFGNEEVPRKFRKSNLPTVQKERSRGQRKPYKTKRHAQHMAAPFRDHNQVTATALELHEMTISLVKRFLPCTPIPLQVKEYDVFLEYTIESITKKTGKSRHLVLSLSLDSYCKRETFQTSRDDTFCVVYLETKKILILEFSESETLRLYAEFARRNLVRDIMERSGDKYKEPEALFLSHDGSALLKKGMDVRSFKERNEQTGLSSFGGRNLTKRHTVVSEHSEDIAEEIDDTNNRKHDDEENDDVSGDELTSISNLDETKRSGLDKTSNTEDDTFDVTEDITNSVPYKRRQYSSDIGICNTSAERTITNHRKLLGANGKYEQSGVRPFNDINEASKYVETEAEPNATAVVCRPSPEERSFSDTLFNKNPQPSAQLTSDQNEDKYFKTEEHTLDKSCVGILCKGMNSVSGLESTNISTLDKTYFSDIASSSVASFAKYPPKTMQSNHKIGQDSNGLPAKRTTVNLHEPEDSDIAHSNETIGGPFISTHVKQEPRSNASSEVILPYNKRIKQIVTSSDASVSNNSLSSSTKPSNQHESTADNQYMTIVEPNVSAVDAIGTDMDFSSYVACSYPDNNQKIEKYHSSATAVKCSENRMQKQHMEDSIDADVRDEPSKRTFFNFDDPEERRNFSKIGKALSLEEMGDAIKSGVAKGTPHNCDASSKENDLQQQTLDAKTFSTDSEKRPYNLDNEIMVACLSCLMQVENYDDRKCSGKYMPLDLD